ncbi:MAG: methyltransferase domain-containing protein [Anaerolineae bacterium]|nr:methyltransferase domain-containing protein [Anaerolineae bacterium]MDW8172259.1 class I SAM-dependent methyltransferase [Anaerolineae bacterium]
MQLADLDFLVSARGQALLTELAQADLSDAAQLPLLTRLRKAYTPAESAAALELVRLRQRARDKFGPQADSLYFTAAALEQASHPLTRAWRAQAWAGAQVIDVGCGIGADSLAFAQAGAHVLGLDIDDLRLAMARLNAQAVSLPAHFERQDARAWQPASADLIFYDPARRSAQGRRLRHVEAYEPPLNLVEVWAGRARVQAKLAPGLDLSQIEALGGGLSFLAVGEDLKEALWDSQPDWATRDRDRRAVLLRPDGALTWSRLAHEPEPPARLSAPRAWLIEPNAALLRAGLVRHAALAWDAALLDETIAYLTSDSPPDTPWARAWRVQAWLPFQLKRLRAALRERGVGRLTVKKRGSPITPEALMTQLRLKGDQAATVVLTRLQGQPIALICDEQPA